MAEQEIIIPELLPPSEDGVFKTLLTHPDAKPVLKDVIANVLDMKIKDVCVRNVELPISHMAEKRERFDVNVEMDGGTQADVEMQSVAMRSDNSANAHRRLRARTIYNLCDLHSSQDGRGVNYNDLLNSYQIMFCGFTVFSETERFVNRFSLRDENGLELLNVVGIVFVEMTKLKKLLSKPVDTMTGLEHWALFFQYASYPEFKQTLAEIAAKRESIKVATELLSSISKDADERARFRSRRMFLMDERTNLDSARKEGISQGREEGRAEGLHQGREEGRAEGLSQGLSQGRIEIAKSAITMGLPLDQIAKITGLALDEIEKLRA